jgi:hypothetical protein
MGKNKSKKFLQYALTGEVNTADLPVHAPKELIDTIQEAYTKVKANNKSVIGELLHWIEKYPDVPQFKNYLCSYYSVNGDHEKANETNNELLKQFPGYLYAKMNQARFCIYNNETDKVPDVLGRSMELCDLYPERKIFHYDEYIHYYQTVAEYYCKINESKKAEAILENLYEVADLFDLETDFEQLENLILLSRLEHIDFNAFNKSRKVIAEREKPTLPQTKTHPVFHYPQIIWLYQYGLEDMPPEKINELLSLEREWLRIDLETVVYDAIKRYDFFKRNEFNNNELDFCLHALYLMKEIKAEESLPVILEILRQPQGLLHFWLSDTLAEHIWQVIYTLGFNQSTKVANFLKEPLNYTFARSEVSEALKQIMLHHPERKKEIVDLYKDVINFFISNKTDQTIVDDMLIELMVDDIVDLNLKELLPEMKMLSDEKLIDEYLTERLQEMEVELDEIPEGEQDEDFKRELQNYFELATEIASWKERDEHDDEENEEDTDYYYDDWEEVKEAEEDKTQYFYSGDTPFVRAAPKVGRNEPCPCGSGKKYKNCHGAND